jgi:dienelactone hydrolase
MLVRTLIVLSCGLHLAAATWPDCDKANPSGDGPFGDMTTFNDTAEDGTLVFVSHPPLSEHTLYPVMVYSHGSTGEWTMYEHAFKRYVSHGFVVIFPHIKGPQGDTSPLTLDPKGDFTIKGVHYATSANSNSSSKLYKVLDLQNLMLAGHSMGASSTIMAAKRLNVGVARAAVAQHPGICGPFGPPPCLGPGPLCNTWMPSDFKEAAGKMPLVLTTATNDGAFWPAPHTAEHEYGCYNQSVGGSSKGTAFVQFSQAACEDDGTGGRYDRHWSTGGHDCPMKQVSVETRWVLTAAKLYAQLGGDSSSHCHKMLWGMDSDSIVKDTAVADLKRNAAGAFENFLLTV